MVEHGAKIAHIKPTTAHFALPKVFGSVNGGPLIRSPMTVMTVPRGMIGVMRAILVIFAARADRDREFCRDESAPR
jgi:hypothetical protein